MTPDHHNTDGRGESVRDASDGRDRIGAALDSGSRTLRRLVEVLRGSTIDVEAYDPDAHGPLVSVHGRSNPGGGQGVADRAQGETSEVERYWVNAPFSFVSVQYDRTVNAHRYRTVEPTLTEIERDIFETVVEDIRDPLLYRTDAPGNGEELLRETVLDLLERYGATVDVPTFYRLCYYVHRDFQGYGRLDPIMHDPHVEDVSCDGYDLPIFVYHERYADVETNVRFGTDSLDRFVTRLAQQSGRHISIGDPIVETTLRDGSRAELALGKEVTPRGSAFTIRKYADEPFTPIDLLEYGTFDVEQLAYLWLVIEHNRSLLFAGGTASGKTTSMNAISMFIPPRAKVLTIEDTRELQLYHDNWLSSVTRERVHEGSDVTMYDLLRSALRHRPEYIIVGEVRGEEAITLFQAMNTGHTTYSTMHADSVQTAINRLENEPIDVPRSMVQSLDVLCVQSLTRFDGERVRRNRVIAEIEGIDQRTGDLDYSNTYSWNGGTDTFSAAGSSVLEDIRDERGWSRRELLTERRRREAFLKCLHANGIDDYRRFTALVNEYYADPEGALRRLDIDDPLVKTVVDAPPHDRAGPRGTLDGADRERRTKHTHGDARRPTNSADAQGRATDEETERRTADGDASQPEPNE